MRIALLALALSTGAWGQTNNTQAFPTIQLPFVLGLLEGLISDNGTVAKRCGGDAVAFASALKGLAVTTIGEVKAVAAAVEEAQKVCSAVEKDVEKLALNAFMDLLHPTRITQNFAACRAEILDDFGHALQLLAIKDFKDAGQKVGMGARRLVEGKDDANSLALTDPPSNTTDSHALAVATITVFTVSHWGASTMANDYLPNATAEQWGNFLAGVLEGLLSDGTDLQDCQAQFPKVRDAVELAMAKVGKALVDLKAAFRVAEQSCGLAAADVWKLLKAAFNDIRHPDQIAKNIAATQYDFLNDLGLSLEALAVNKYDNAGILMGMSLRMALEGSDAPLTYPPTPVPPTPPTPTPPTPIPPTPPTPTPPTPVPPTPTPPTPTPPTPAPPAPPTPPSPPVPGGAHYGRPPCGSDEDMWYFSNNVANKCANSHCDHDHVMCSKDCAQGSCPTDVPEGTSAAPMCRSDPDGTHCVLACSGDGDCPADANCQMGVCWYPHPTFSLIV